MTLDSYMYGDPERIAIRHQEAEMRKHRACGSCIHRMRVEFNGNEVNVCEFRHRKYGRRCEQFSTKGKK